MAETLMRRPGRGQPERLRGLRQLHELGAVAVGIGAERALSGRDHFFETRHTAIRRALEQPAPVAVRLLVADLDEAQLRSATARRAYRLVAQRIGEADRDVGLGARGD